MTGALFTIGYEGRTANSASTAARVARFFRFSDAARRASVGIRYEHLPDAGECVAEALDGLHAKHL